MPDHTALAAKLRIALDHRGLDEADLAEMTGLPISIITGLLGDDAAQCSNEDIRSIAAALFVRPLWLQSDQASGTPVWLPGKRSLLPHGPDKPHNTRADLAVYTKWITVLEARWIAHLDLKRDAPTAASVMKMLVEDSDAWPRRCHRSIVLLPAASAFTGVQLLRLSELLKLGKLKDLTIPSLEQITSVQQQQRFDHDARRRAATEAIVGPLDDVQWTLHANLLDRKTTRVDTVTWPFATSSDGQSYGVLTTQLADQLERLAVMLDESQKPKRGRPRKDSRPAGGEDPRLVADAYQEAMWQVFRQHLPDDPEVTLADAVRTYRQFLKKVTIIPTPTGVAGPDRGRDVHDVLERIELGRIVQWEDLVGHARSLGVCVRRLKTWCDRASAPGQGQSDPGDQADQADAGMDEARDGQPRVLLKVYRRGKSMWVLRRGLGD